MDEGDYDSNLNEDCPRCDNPQGDDIIAEIDGDNLDREVEDMVVTSDGSNTYKDDRFTALNRFADCLPPQADKIKTGEYPKLVNEKQVSKKSFMETVNSLTDKSCSAGAKLVLFGR